MILFTNDTAKEYNNEVSYRLPRTQRSTNGAGGAIRATPRTDADARLLAGLDQAAHCIAVCAFTLTAITVAIIFLSLAPSITGQAQEAQGRDWMGEKLSARSYQAPAWEARR
jgi:hypothetical protein